MESKHPKNELPETFEDLLTPKARAAFDSAKRAEDALKKGEEEDRSWLVDHRPDLSGVQIEAEVQRLRKKREQGLGLTALRGGESENDPPEVERGRRGIHGQPLGGSKTTKQGNPRPLTPRQLTIADAGDGPEPK